MEDFSRRVWRCIYNIPICGGFCAPTANTDESCYRHVSNEYTVPFSLVMWKRRACMETNFVCVCVGRTGSSWGDRRRTYIMSLALAMNLFLIVLYIIGAMGITTDADLLKKTYWSYGERYASSSGATTKTYLGVNMRYDEVDCGASTIQNTSQCMAFSMALGFELAYDTMMARRVEWGEPGACKSLVQNATGFNTELVHEFQDANEAATIACEECQARGYSERALILGVMMQLPTATTNCQRSTRFGDVNCQHFFGLVTNFFGLLTSVGSMRLWYTACYRNMPEEINAARVTWSLGTSFKLLVLATFCKLFDMLAHCIVPTPDRSHLQGSGVDSLAGYMQLANTQVVRSSSSLGSSTPVGAPLGKANE